MCSRYDFNADIAGGPTLGTKVMTSIQGPFDRFLSGCFDPAPEGEDNEGEGQSGGTKEEGKGRVTKSSAKTREDPVKKVMRADGSIWIPEVTGASRPVLQSMVRGFLTAHYSKWNSNCSPDHSPIPCRKSVQEPKSFGPIQAVSAIPGRPFLKGAFAPIIHLRR